MKKLLLIAVSLIILASTASAFLNGGFLTGGGADGSMKAFAPWGIMDMGLIGSGDGPMQASWPGDTDGGMLLVDPDEPHYSILDPVDGGMLSIYPGEGGYKAFGGGSETVFFYPQPFLKGIDSDDIADPVFFYPQPTLKGAGSQTIGGGSETVYFYPTTLKGGGSPTLNFMEIIDGVRVPTLTGGGDDGLIKTISFGGKDETIDLTEPDMINGGGLTKTIRFDIPSAGGLTWGEEDGLIKTILFSPEECDYPQPFKGFSAISDW